jgi:hypothetical protein
MLILSNALALALIVADEPPPSETPTAAKSGEPAAAVGAQEAWNLALRDAIRIGLENSELIRVTRQRIQGGGGFEPTPLNIGIGRAEPAQGVDIEISMVDRDMSIWKFQSDAMAHIRSIEQQYWALWQQQVALKAREAAIRESEKVLARERAELEVGRSNPAEVAEVEQQLENFKLNLVSAASDLVTVERQFRNILGLPSADGRRIVAVTPPIEARVEPDWESSLRAMNASQPDIARQNAIVRAAEFQLMIARNQLLPLMSQDELDQLNGLGDQLNQFHPYSREMIRRYVTQRISAGFNATPPAGADSAGWQIGLAGAMSMAVGRSPISNTRQAQYQLLRQRATLQQITHQTTHTLARFFLEVDANYKQYAAAQRLNVDARQRLEAQRAFYEEGRITVDRLLDAICQQANTIAQEALYLAKYNGSLASLEEAKGTLLAYDGIALAEDPRPLRIADAKDESLVPAAFEKPAEVPVPAPAASKPSVKTFKLKAKLGLGGLDLDIEVREGSEAKPVGPSSP